MRRATSTPTTTRTALLPNSIRPTRWRASTTTGPPVAARRVRLSNGWIGYGRLSATDAGDSGSAPDNSAGVWAAGRRRSLHGDLRAVGTSLVMKGVADGRVPEGPSGYGLPRHQKSCGA